VKSNFLSFGGEVVTFEEVLSQAIAMLQRQGRVSYRALKRQFDLDDSYLEDLKAEIIDVHQVAVDQDGTMLVWTGGTTTTPSEIVPKTVTSAAQPKTEALAPAAPHEPEAERRQLTVLFCDLVDSTALSSQLDPEELREVIRAYQDTCAKVIARFEGYIAQLLGDGLLVYFGYPRAHEDDAQRAVRAGLGIVEALGQLNARLRNEPGVQVAARLGCHTGLVVVGEMSSGTRQEQLALGETPNLAARLQGMAAPDTLVVSAATFQLLGGFFACQPLGASLLKGFAQPVEVYRVLYESMARSRLEAAESTGLTPFVGREQEVAVLRERWGQVKEGSGHVVLLSGEAGIGKSRLVQMLKEQVAAEPQAWLTPCQCSPYYQNTALYPMIELLERVALRFERDETAEQKLRKLEGLLVQYGLPLPETVPLLAALLSLPLTANYTPLTVSPEQQKQQTLGALLTIQLRIAAQQPVLFVMEDLHWVDPTTLEFLSLVVDQGPTAPILALWTFRPDFSPPWTGRVHLTQVTLPRLARRQAAEMISRVAHGKTMPAEVVEQVVAKTDGVPLFVEELTKMVLESSLLQEREERYELNGLLPPLAIPTTLHDSLMARLDRLAAVKGLAQLAATLGREFSYELLHAVSPLNEETLQRGLQQLVAAEFLYQRGLPPQATYLFKHALIQDAAYQSLLRSTRQQHHQRIARVLEAQFPDTAETQPELLAHHYTEAGLNTHAVPYWQRAGQRASERSAYVDAVAHLTQALVVLKPLPDTTERARQELVAQMTLGPVLMAIKGGGAPEVERVYTRARELCERVGQPAELFHVLWGVWFVYNHRGEHRRAREMGEELLSLAQRIQDPDLLLEAHHALWAILFFAGELTAARLHLEEGVRLYDPQRHRLHAARYTGHDPGVCCHVLTAQSLWLLGYPDQAVASSQVAIEIAQQLAHPYSVAFALSFAAMLHQCRCEAPLTHARAKAILTLGTEQGNPQVVERGLCLRGWALATSGHEEEGITEIRQALATYRSAGAKRDRPYYLALLAEACAHGGQTTEGLEASAEALALLTTSGVRWWEAELHRLRGELLLQSGVQSPESSVVTHHSGLCRPDEAEAEACFQRALDLAHRQQAKSLELRTAMSLSRLWQRQGKRAEARALLAPIYGWFTEGFDTADLQEAKALLVELGS
jgi:predicted ATPase/class 3 adenylate cyclase